MVKTTAEELKQQKAKSLRYKKPIASHMNYDFILEQVDDMREMVDNVQWFTADEDNLVHALSGDEDEAWEFKMAFSDLAGQLESLAEDLRSEYIPDCFDDLFPAVGADYFGGYLGFDEYDQDYFNLAPYEYGVAEKSAEKRILRMTKKELLEVVGACLKVYTPYVALQYRYDCLEASLKILQEKNLDRLKVVKAIDEQYDKAESESNHFSYKYHPEVRKLDTLLDQMPQEFWL